MAIAIKIWFFCCPFTLKKTWDFNESVMGYPRAAGDGPLLCPAGPVENSPLLFYSGASIKTTNLVNSLLCGVQFSFIEENRRERNFIVVRFHQLGNRKRCDLQFLTFCWFYLGRTWKLHSFTVCRKLATGSNCAENYKDFENCFDRTTNVQNVV